MRHGCFSKQGTIFTFWILNQFLGEVLSSYMEECQKNKLVHTSIVARVLYSLPVSFSCTLFLYLLPVPSSCNFFLYFLAVRSCCSSFLYLPPQLISSTLKMQPDERKHPWLRYTYVWQDCQTRMTFPRFLVRLIAPLEPQNPSL